MVGLTKFRFVLTVVIIALFPYQNHLCAQKSEIPEQLSGPAAESDGAASDSAEDTANDTDAENVFERPAGASLLAMELLRLYLPTFASTRRG